MARPFACACALLLAVTAATTAARGDWRRTTDLNSNTAFTLEQGTVEIGVLSPLAIGVTDELQVAIHPILLLLGQPYLALRWRATRYGDATVAFNLAGSWSFIRREDEAGQAAGEDDPGSGFPGTMHLTGTLTLRAGDDWLFSMGAGPGLDLLGARPIRGLVEVHAGIHWLPEASQLVMLHASGYIATQDGGELLRPLVELIYAVALSNVVHLSAGIGVGEFVFEPSAGRRQMLEVFPVVDLGFRF